MNRNIYRHELRRLVKKMNGVRNTPFAIFAKVTALVAMNIRYEKIAFDMRLKRHPFMIVRDIIADAGCQFDWMTEIGFIEAPDRSIERFKERRIEKKHRALWQEIWDRYNEAEFQQFVDLKRFRLRKNRLAGYVRGKKCVDFGCGNGSFSFAMLECGARSVDGLDFGDKSIRYARAVARKRGLDGSARFLVRDVTASGLPGNSFDFAVSNGVFHHLKKAKIPHAVREVARVLKKGGWFWYYVDGKDAISMDLFDASVAILKGIDLSYIENILKLMNVGRSKMVHLMDGMNATYIHSAYDEVAAMLAKQGFGEFRRLTGAAATDFDLDRILRDPYGREKFGEGDLRILCRLIRK